MGKVRVEECRKHFEVRVKKSVSLQPNHASNNLRIKYLNKKFVYGALRIEARAKDFEMAIHWLVDAGLAYRISRTELYISLK